MSLGVTLTPKTPSEAQKLEATEKKIWVGDPIIPVKLTKWQCSQIINDYQITFDENITGQSKGTRKEITRMYIYPYKSPTHQVDNLNKKPSTAKEKREPRFRKHNCVREGI